jgi:hypothetical protein
MGKKTTSLLAATFAFSAMLPLLIVGCDGPVEKSLDCITICREAESCVGGEDFDKAECKEQCNEEAEADDVDRCQQCLNDQTSCSEDLKCTAECTGVLADIVFK